MRPAREGRENGDRLLRRLLQALLGFNEARP